MHQPVIQATEAGLYCSAGDFYIDPWRPVERAIITHAHADHARVGSNHYFCTEDGLPLLKHRLGAEQQYQTLPYGQQLAMGPATVSLHPAGHILGSAQVRVEVGGEVWAISGDYKRDADPTCKPFEVVPCHQFITEATFALPIYRWQSTPETVRGIYEWWMACRRKNRTALLFCYALGKAQRVLSELMRYTDEPVYLHGAVEGLTRIYREAGVPMIKTIPVVEAEKKSLPGELVLAPPSAFRSLWMKRFKDLETGFASGWMRVRAGRRQRGYDRGFVLSDHADWPQLLQTVQQTKAQQIWVTHGKADLLVRYLNEAGYSAGVWGSELGEQREPEGLS
ncbi:ligase-associated DNA damage response exonuclease [Vampirovibrio sp.]|uniref:ligase-associated DNA damage response exonuclease n=1 Tax=Vampirovibrio sp. TaxID=2717857 RepID=UPI003593BF46